MNGDKSDSNTLLIPSVSLFRGIYNRVAKRLGVDPSYVSRVARGERKSEVVEKALAEEVRMIREHLNNHESNHEKSVLTGNAATQKIAGKPKERFGRDAKATD